MSRLVPMDDFAIEIRASDAAATRTDLQALLQVAPSELERRRERMLKWLPMMSWMLDRRTTAMYLLAQAAQPLRERQMQMQLVEGLLQRLEAQELECVSVSH